MDDRRRDRRRAHQRARPRSRMTLMTVFALVALTLVALAIYGVLASLLYKVSATDPLTLGGTAAVLVASALLASWVPARRATRVDPAGSLRVE